VLLKEESIIHFDNSEIGTKRMNVNRDNSWSSYAKWNVVSLLIWFLLWFYWFGHIRLALNWSTLLFAYAILCAAQTVMSVGLKFTRDKYLASDNISGIVVTVACFVVFCCVGASYLAEHSGLIDHAFALTFSVTVVIMIPVVSGVAHYLLRDSLRDMLRHDD
jgi:hypothetical protein